VPEAARRHRVHPCRRRGRDRPAVPRRDSGARCLAHAGDPPGGRRGPPDRHREAAATSIPKRSPRSPAAAVAAAVAALLDNRACRPRPSDYRRIYERFVDEPEIVERLLERPDLPPELRILHARQAAARVESLLATRGWMAPGDAEAFLAEAEEAAILRILETSEPRHLDRLMAFLSTKDMLHASLILRAACRGRMAVVEQALSWLSSVPRKAGARPDGRTGQRGAQGGVRRRRAAGGILPGVQGGRRGLAQDRPVSRLDGGGGVRAPCGREPDDRLSRHAGA
jgi:hypothetical protein